ncbi:MAG: aminoglycoside phosphotransferase family protein [Chloroflexi bacterium]|nr:aminoglycoside phosphotransferase family protein [Chloroflexota bacterium]
MTFTIETLHQIIHHHRPNLTDNPHITPITTGKFNTSYLIQTDEEDMVLRIAPPRNAMFVFYERNMMRQEPQLHTLLRAETDVPVARILAFDDSLTLIDRDYVLMERLPGRPLTEMGHVNYSEVMVQIGTHLAQVHKLQSIQHGYLGAHRPMAPQPRWQDAFAIMWHKMIHDIAQIGYYDEAESSKMQQLLDKHLHLFDKAGRASLLHMDIWHQNILVDDDGLVTGIVDWDRALWGDPEIEFAVLDYCGISEPPFWEGYGRPRNTSPEAKTRQVFYLLYELQKYIVIRYGRSHDPQSAHQYKQQVAQIIAHFFQQ